MIKKILKIVLPKTLIEWGWQVITSVEKVFYSFKFKPLIVRADTTDIRVFRSVFVRNELKLPVSINPKLIIDAGAYTGFSTLYYATKYPEAKIIAIEPENSNFSVLEQHTASYKNIKRIKAGLWHKNAHLKVVDKQEGEWAFAVEEVAENVEYDISAVTVDSILRDTGFDRIDILKLDIEGAEKEVFGNNTELWIDKVDIVVIELHDWLRQGCSQAFYSAFNRSKWEEYKEGEKVVMVRKELKYSAD